MALPHSILRSPQFAALPGPAVKALFGLLAQYNGRNNGNLTAAISVMQSYGWTSRDTLKRAIDHLLSAGFITITRKGGNRIARLFAVTFFAVDDCGARFDDGVKPTAAPPGAWKRADPLKKKTRDRLTVRSGTVSRGKSKAVRRVSDRLTGHNTCFCAPVSTRLTVPLIDLPWGNTKRPVNSPFVDQTDSPGRIT